MVGIGRYGWDRQGMAGIGRVWLGQTGCDWVRQSMVGTDRA